MACRESLEADGPDYRRGLGMYREQLGRSFQPVDAEELMQGRGVKLLAWFELWCIFGFRLGKDRGRITCTMLLQHFAITPASWIPRVNQ